jgi:hypothetical protein
MNPHSGMMMKNEPALSMKREKSSVLSILLLAVAVQSSFGQVRLNVTDYISRKLENYCSNASWEEVYLRTDRDTYIAGEEIWFSAYTFNRKALDRSSESKLLYIELLAPDNKPLIKQRFSLENGYGPGQVLLPDTLSSGTYRLRAYTGWMKNFLPGNCFNKDIAVYNAISDRPFRNRILIDNPDPDLGSERMHERVEMKVVNSSSDSIEIVINTGSVFRTEGNESVYLVVDTHGRLDIDKSVKLDGDITRIHIPRSALTPGINHFTIFDRSIIPVCERYFYSRRSEDKSNIPIKSAETARPRSKITIEFELPGDIKNPDISVSVAAMNSITDKGDASDYLLFGSEFGTWPFDFLKGRNIDELSQAAIDSLLGSIQSKWIRWSQVLDYKPPFFSFSHEAEDHYLTGKMVKADGKPAPEGEYVVLSVPGRVPVFQYAVTDKNGNFSFLLPINQDKRDLVIQPGGIAGNFKIVMESTFSDQSQSSGRGKESASATFPLYIAEWSSNFQVSKIYGISNAGNSIPIAGKASPEKRFYGKPETEIRLDDYMKLPIMEEVFFELVPRVILKNENSAYDLYIIDPLRNRMYNYPPVIMIDGVIFNNPAVVGAMDPSNVYMIDVIKALYVVGDYHFPGIISIFTKSTDYKNMALPPSAVRIPYQVAQAALPFYSPDYTSTAMHNRRVPDLRNTMFWNPSVKSGNNGKYSIEFWSSDFCSDYEISVQGLTADGKCFSLSRKISVK